MSFKMVALVFLKLAEGLSPDPVHTATRPDPFATEAECTNFIQTEEGQAERKMVLEEFASLMHGAKNYVVLFGCKAVEAKGSVDDGKI